MFGGSLVLALALGPEPATANTPPPPTGELPHWQSAPPPPPKRSSERPKVPVDGHGLITFGSILLGTGAALGFTSVGITIADEHLRNRTPRDATAISGVIGMVGGGLLVTLGLISRGHFRLNPANHYPEAPHTGNGMLLGGIGLLALGTGFTVHAVVDMTDTCESPGCDPERPIGAPVQLGFALSGIAIGTGLVFGGVKRRLGYERWAKQRAQLQPTFAVAPTSFVIGLAGRF